LIKGEEMETVTENTLCIMAYPFSFSLIHASEAA
jgi:hypothetical protein